MKEVVTGPGRLLLQPSKPQVSSVSSAISLWKGAGEGVIAKMVPDGRMLLSTCCEGTWSFLFVKRDGMADGHWF